MQEGTVVRWLKAEGSTIQIGEPIVEIETDKAIVEFESYASGLLGRILVSEGTTVSVGDPIAVISQEGEIISEVATETTTHDEQSASTISVDTSPSKPIVDLAAAVDEPPSSTKDEVKASPVAKKLASEMGVQLEKLRGTGPGGRITKDDVLASSPDSANLSNVDAIEDISIPVDTETNLIPIVSNEPIPLSRMRQQIARVTVKSKQEKPHFYISSDIDMTRSMDLRRDLNQTLEAEGIRISVNDLIVKACVTALTKYPKFNAYLKEDSIQMNDKINVGIAVAEKEGLIVPAIMDCGLKSLKQLAVESKDLSNRAQNGTLHPQEYTGGTFAVSNLGMFDVTSFVAIIYPPQTAVLAVGTVSSKPVVRDNEIAVSQVMTATLSADHRIVDGAEGAQFIVTVKELLEDPLSLLL